MNNRSISYVKKLLVGSRQTDLGDWKISLFVCTTRLNLRLELNRHDDRDDRTDSSW